MGSPITNILHLFIMFIKGNKKAIKKIKKEIIKYED